MQNLQTSQFGVEEINDTEMLTIDGGFWGAVVRVVAGVAAAAGVQILADWDDFKAGLSGEDPKH